ncbi:pilin [Patescibacteria group bacterium]|nr:pilin [Patescibacteria group bacterium]
MFTKNIKILLALSVILLLTFALGIKTADAGCCFCEDEVPESADQESDCRDECVFENDDSVCSQVSTCQNNPTAPGCTSKNWVEQIVGGPLIPYGCTTSCIEWGSDDKCTNPKGAGECGFNDVVKMIANFSKLLLGVVGSLALLMFIYGGLMFVIAEGKEERIQKAKDVLKNAAIGLLIVFTAWIIVNVVIAALTGQSIGEPADLFKQGTTGQGTPWNQPSAN